MEQQSALLARAPRPLVGRCCGESNQGMPALPPPLLCLSDSVDLGKRRLALRHSTTAGRCSRVSCVIHRLARPRTSDTTGHRLRVAIDPGRGQTGPDAMLSRWTTRALRTLYLHHNNHAAITVITVITVIVPRVVARLGTARLLRHDDRAAPGDGDRRRAHLPSVHGAHEGRRVEARVTARLCLGQFLEVLLSMGTVGGARTRRGTQT